MNKDTATDGTLIIKASLMSRSNAQLFDELKRLDLKICDANPDRGPQVDVLIQEKLATVEILRERQSTSDHISYLKDAKNDGIVTTLSKAYEAEILKETGCESLDKARRKLAAIV